jgi:hypothetical protein
MKRKLVPATLAEAVADEDPLLSIQLVIDQGTPSWDWFTLMYGAVLETHSGGPRMLLDRFAFSEVKMLASEFARIGAPNSAAAICEFVGYAESRFGAEPSDDQVIDLLDDAGCEALHRKHVIRFREYCAEMERSLVAYVVAHSSEFKKPA